jgi:hypothetical protein
MTTGYSGTYAINNVDLALQPSSGKWLGRTEYGVDGGAHPIYSRVRKFELKWDLISSADLQQIVGLYNIVGSTGTVVSCLPGYGATDYIFQNYSGTTLQEPEFGEYFQGYVSDVKLIILNVRTN